MTDSEAQREQCDLTYKEMLSYRPDREVGAVFIALEGGHAASEVGSPSHPRGSNAVQSRVNGFLHHGFPVAACVFGEVNRAGGSGHFRLARTQGRHAVGLTYKIRKNTGRDGQKT